MKICSKCNQTYADDTLNFCLEDGSLLSPFDRKPAAHEEIKTVVQQKSPATVRTSSPKTGGFGLKTVVVMVGLIFFLFVAVVLAVGVYQFRDSLSSLFDPQNTPVNGPPTGNNSTEKAALTAVWKKAERALLDQDINALGEVLADEYVEEYSTGEKITKLQILIGLPFVERSSVEHMIRDIQINGNKATMTGTGTTRLKTLEGDTTYRYEFETDFKKRDGRWEATYAYIKYLE